MLTGLWPSTGGSTEYALAFDRAREKRLLVVPALLDEGNKLRHFTVEVMRLLEEAGFDSVLPDLPGTNESLQSLRQQTLESWSEAMNVAADHFGATHVLTIRAGALVAPSHLPNIHYAPASGASQLRALLRAQAVAAREHGRSVARDDLLERGRIEGLRLVGYDLGPAMIAGLEHAIPHSEHTEEIAQGDLGGAALWLRAEPDHDRGQAAKLAEMVKRWLA